MTVEDENEATSADNEIARRRQERQDREAAEAAAADGKSIAEMADDDEQEELFPLGTVEGDPKKTLKNLIKPGLPVEVTASLMSAEVPVSAGMIDPDSPGRVMVSYEIATAAQVVVKRKEGRIVGYKIRQVLRPTFVEAIADAAADPASATG